MGWTKRQYIEQAFSAIGMAGYVFDLEPQQLQTALARLDSMMATWNAKGIRIGYPAPSSPQNSNIDEETSVPDSANEAIYCGLGIRIAPDFGKTVSGEVKFIAKTAYDTLLALASTPLEKQFPGTLPAGAGNKPWRNNDSPFLNPPCDPLLAGPDSVIEYD
ncbi:packaged DNA stabilization gp4 family protein [Pseudomonas chlororaphis]|uniref:packaged DNA stabilization gp4 family protein n=1 Tax=Pseudomonas chlororaphis TaxID=587753 RepID=UPI000BE2A674|nr:packaged DNA stabilization gp4 family protein [Pseudomonas chlororaphis]